MCGLKRSVRRSLYVSYLWELEFKKEKRKFPNYLFCLEKNVQINRVKAHLDPTAFFLLHLSMCNNMSQRA